MGGHGGPPLQYVLQRPDNLTPLAIAINLSPAQADKYHLPAQNRINRLPPLRLIRGWPSSVDHYIKETRVMKRSLTNRGLAITLIVLPVLFASGPVAFAQRNPEKELPLKQLLSLPGKLVSEAKSARPTTDL